MDFKKIKSKEYNRFFYYQKSENVVYTARIGIFERLGSKMDFELKNKGEKNENHKFRVLNLLFNDGWYTVKFKNELELCKVDILKDVYAKSNAKKVGDREYSIFESLKSGDFLYATPVIDTDLFMKKDTFREKLLYDNNIIPSLKEDRKSYAQIVKEDGEYYLSLTNEKMKKIDTNYIIHREKNNQYRPYFYEFELTKDSEEKIFKKVKEKKYELGEFYEVKIISEKNINKVEEESGEFYYGEIFFSASPSRSIKAYIEFVITDKSQEMKDAFDQIMNSLTDSINTFIDENDIKRKFTEKLDISFFEQDLNYKVDVFNVAQGNWNQISIMENQKLVSKIIFDIGIGTKKTTSIDKVLNIASREINDSKEPYIFVLSHWDLDHIKGITRLKTERLNTTWIMPELPRNPSQAAIRMAAYLNFCNDITDVFISDSLNNNLIFRTPQFELGKGSGKAGSYTANNNLGLILTINTECGKKMLFPGDCEYSKFPPDLQRRFSDYYSMVLTHHGANSSCFSNNTDGNNPIIENRAVVSVGNDVNYPALAHEEYIQSFGFRIEITRNYNIQQWTINLP